MQHGFLQIVELLIDHRADVHNLLESASPGQHLINLATASGHVALVRFLHEKGASLTQRNNYGRAAIHVAAQTGHTRVTEYLLQQGVDLRVCLGGDCMSGSSPLEIARKHKHFSLVETLKTAMLAARSRGTDGRSEL